VGLINVYYNGVLLRPTDYTAANGTSVTLATAVTSATDVVTFQAWGAVTESSNTSLLGTAAKANVGVSGNAVPLLNTSVTFGDDLFVEKEGGTEVDLGVRGYNVGPVMHGYRAGGTKTAPTALPSGSLIYGLGGRPHTGSGWTAHSTAAIHFLTTEAQSLTNQGSALQFMVTPQGKTHLDRIVGLRLEGNVDGAGRIISRFSGAVSGRTMVQTDENPGSTSLAVLPKGALAGGANLTVWAREDISQSERVYIECTNGGESAIVADRSGAVPFAPLGFWVGGGKRLQINTDGKVLFPREALVGPIGAAGSLGAIIEQGTGSNGRYTKFADGTLLMFGEYVGAITMATTGVTGLYTGSVTLTMPSTMVNDSARVLSFSGNNPKYHRLGRQK
jgi:hypothetical protein